MQDFEKTNLFMKFSFKNDDTSKEEIRFVYSNEEGIKNLNKLKINELCANLFSDEEILTKLAYSIADKFTFNSDTYLNGNKWIGKNLIIFNIDKENFDNEYIIWKNKIEKLVGKDNLFEVEVTRKELYEYIKSVKAQNEDILNYLESTRLNNQLEKTLSVNERKTKRKL